MDGVIRAQTKGRKKGHIPSNKGKPHAPPAQKRSVHMPESRWLALRAEAASRGISGNEAVNQAVVAWLADCPSPRTSVN